MVLIRIHVITFLLKDAYLKQVMIVSRLIQALMKMVEELIFLVLMSQLKIVNSLKVMPR